MPGGVQRRSGCRGVVQSGPGGRGGGVCAVLVLWLHGRQVDSGVPAAKLGVGGQGLLPRLVGGVVPRLPGFGGFLQRLPA